MRQQNERRRQRTTHTETGDVVMEDFERASREREASLPRPPPRILPVGPTSSSMGGTTPSICGRRPLIAGGAGRRRASPPARLGSASPPPRDAPRSRCRNRGGRLVALLGAARLTVTRSACGSATSACRAKVTRVSGEVTLADPGELRSRFGTNFGRFGPSFGQLRPIWAKFWAHILGPAQLKAHGAQIGQRWSKIGQTLAADAVDGRCCSNCSRFSATFPQ